MVTLGVMLAGWLTARVLGALGLLDSAGSWSGALRFGLAAMFIFTAIAHFTSRTRLEMIRMVPPQLPQAAFLVTLTGILESAGAAGLLTPGFVRPAAYCLIVLLLTMFPANVRAAREKLFVAGRPAMPLSLRLPLQIFWIGALWWVAA
jgi:uncharacterized membrane protein